ncbi:EndoU domain-containing protein [Cohnella sp. M.A.Huq-80]
MAQRNNGRGRSFQYSQRTRRDFEVVEQRGGKAGEGLYANHGEVSAAERLPRSSEARRLYEVGRKLRMGEYEERQKISKLKKSTLFPDSWTDEQILESIIEVGNSPAISARLRDGATWHRATINGVEIDVIKVGDDVTSGYPTGAVNASLPSGF